MLLVKRMYQAAQHFASNLAYGKNEYKPNYFYLAEAVENILQECGVSYYAGTIAEFRILTRKLAESTGILPSSHSSALYDSVERHYNGFIQNITQRTSFTESDVRLMISRKSRELNIKTNLQRFWKYFSPLLFSVLFLATPADNFVVFSLKTVFLVLAIAQIVSAYQTSK